METFETNVPNLFIAGGAIAGKKTGNIFIENGRFHGRRSSSAGRYGCAATDSDGLVERHLPRPPAARRVHLHLEQVDQRAAARQHAVAFEQRLVFERRRGRGTAPAR